MARRITMDACWLIGSQVDFKGAWYYNIVNKIVELNISQWFVLIWECIGFLKNYVVIVLKASLVNSWHDMCLIEEESHACLLSAGRVHLTNLNKRAMRVGCLQAACISLISQWSSMSEGRCMNTRCLHRAHHSILLHDVLERWTHCFMFIHGCSINNKHKNNICGMGFAVIWTWPINYYQLLVHYYQEELHISQVGRCCAVPWVKTDRDPPPKVLLIDVRLPSTCPSCSTPSSAYTDSSPNVDLRWLCPVLSYRNYVHRFTDNITCTPISALQ